MKHIFMYHTQYVLLRNTRKHFTTAVDDIALPFHYEGFKRKDL